MKVMSENGKKRINFDVVPMNAVIRKKRKISESSTASSSDSSTLNKATTSKKRRCKKARMDSSLPNILNMDCPATPKCRPKRDYHEIDNILSEIELELKPKAKKLNKSLPSNLSKASKAPKFTIIESSDSDVSTASARTTQKSVSVTVQGTKKILPGKDVQSSISSSKSKASKKNSNKNNKGDLLNLLKTVENDLSKEKHNCESDKSGSKRKRAISINEIKDVLPDDIVCALLTDSEEPIKGKKKKGIVNIVEQRATITKRKDENMINIVDVVTVNQKDHPVKKSVKGNKCLRKVNEKLAINLNKQDDDNVLMIKGSVKHNMKKSEQKKEEHKNVINLDLLTNDFKLEKEKSPDDKKCKRKKKSNIIRNPHKLDQANLLNELPKFKSPKESINTNKDQKRLRKENEELGNVQESADGYIMMIKQSPDSSMEMLNSVENLQNVNLTNANDDKKRNKKQILKCGNLMEDEKLNELNNQKKSVKETIMSLNESMNIKVKSINEQDIHHEWIIKQSPGTSAAEMDSEDEQLLLPRNTMVCLETVNSNENSSENSTRTIINKKSDSQIIRKDIEKLAMSEQYSEKATKQNIGAEFAEVLTVNNIGQKDIETTSLCSPSTIGRNSNDEFKTLSSGKSTTINDNMLSIQTDNIVEDCVQSSFKCKAEKKGKSKRKLIYVGRQDLNRVLKNEQNKLVKNVERGCKPLHNIKNISFDTQKMITEAVRMAILKRDWDSIPYLLSHAIEMGNSYFPGYISETLMTYLMVRRNECNNEVLLEECQKLMFRKMTEKDKISELVMHLDE